jgi:hypothetical protein
MAELTPFFSLPLTRIERRGEASSVDGTLIRVEVVGDVGGAQRLLTITDARVGQPATARIGECAIE